MTIPRDMIGAVIGPGGKVIQEMQRETNTVINIEEVDNMGVIDIAAPCLDDINKAVARIKAITAVPEVGEIYEGTVKSIMPFGAFVEIIPGTDGLLHISEVEYRRLESLDGILKEGDKIQVKLIAIDEKTGKLKLSHKVLLPKPEGYVEPEKRERRERSDRGERNDNHRRPNHGNERHGRPERRHESGNDAE